MPPPPLLFLCVCRHPSLFNHIFPRQVQWPLSYQAPTTWTFSPTRFQLPELVHLPGSDYLVSFPYQVPTTWTRSLTRLRLPRLVLLPGSSYLDSFTYQALTTWTFSPTRLRPPGLIHLLAPTTLNQLLVFVHHATSLNSFILSLKTFTFQKPLLQSRFPAIHVCQCLLMFVFVRYTEEFVSP